MQSPFYLFVKTKRALKYFMVVYNEGHKNAHIYFLARPHVGISLSRVQKLKAEMFPEAKMFIYGE